MKGDEVGKCVRCGSFSKLPVWWDCDRHRGHCPRCDRQTERELVDGPVTVSPHV